MCKKKKKKASGHCCECKGRRERGAKTLFVPLSLKRAGANGLVMSTMDLRRDRASHANTEPAGPLPGVTFSQRDRAAERIHGWSQLPDTFSHVSCLFADISQTCLPSQSRRPPAPIPSPCPPPAGAAEPAPSARVAQPRASGHPRAQPGSVTPCQHGGRRRGKEREGQEDTQPSAAWEERCPPPDADLTGKTEMWIKSLQLLRSSDPV